MKEIDGGELDYFDDNISLRDMLIKCLDFMNIEAENIEETNIWKVNRKGYIVNHVEDYER